MSRGRRLRFVVFFINAMSMTYTICCLFEDVRPFDWLMLVVEVAVLLAILIFEVRAICRERHHDREQRDRRILVAQRVAALRDAMSKGQKLRLCTPGSGDPHVEEWAQAVTNWGEETRVLLESFSAHAGAVFVTQMSSSPHITGSEGALFEYISLISRLDNLRGIIEKPDVYF
jgi:hypothetical protein